MVPLQVTAPRARELALGATPAETEDAKEPRRLIRERFGGRPPAATGLGRRLRPALRDAQPPAKVRQYLLVRRVSPPCPREPFAIEPAEKTLNAQAHVVRHPAARVRERDQQRVDLALVE